MRAEMVNSTTIRIKKVPDNSAIVENAISNVTKHLNALKFSCSDRTLELFPTEDVRRIIKNCEIIRKEIDDLYIDKEYFEYVLQNKNAFEYFEMKLKELKEKQDTFDVKRNVFKKFYTMLSEVKKNHFD